MERRAELPIRFQISIGEPINNAICWIFCGHTISVAEGEMHWRNKVTKD